MKPKWSDAPSWANFLSMDASGVWYWHQLKPTRDDAEEWWMSSGLMECAGSEEATWVDSLEAREDD